MKAPTLRDLIARVLRDQFGGVQAGLASALDLDQTHVSRLLRGHTTTLSVESCLRLARSCDLDPNEVLALAGKDDIGHDIRLLYGKAAPVRAALTAQERAWLAIVRDLSPEHRASLLGLAKALPRA